MIDTSFTNMRFNNVESEYLTETGQTDEELYDEEITRDSIREKWMREDKLVDESIVQGLCEYPTSDAKMQSVICAYRDGDDTALGKAVRALAIEYRENMVELFYDEDYD